MKRILLLLFFFLLPSFRLSAEELRVTSTFDKRSVRINEEIRLTIRVTGAQGNIQAPRLPAFRGFDTFYTGRASHITFVNNVSSSSIEFSYVLVPKTAGNFTLDPIEVVVGSQSFRTDPVQIQVQEDSVPRPSPPRTPTPAPPAPPAGPITQEPPPAFRPEDDNIFVKAWVDKITAYPNEQILLSYSLYTRYDTRYEGFEEEAEVSGFWIEEFPMERDITRETVHVNGKRYVKADIKKVALFPTSPADYTIQPGTLKVSIRQEPEASSIFDEFFNDSFFSGGSFFARRENRILKPPLVEVTVKPFPEAGKPKNFEGAVGNFRLSAALDKQSVKQNEPVTMTLVIEGEGNIETLNKPKLPELPAFKIYDSDTSSQLFKTGNVIGGRKTFEIVFIPTQAGRLAIPKLSFSFFHPVRAAYQTLETPEFMLNVTPSDQTFQLPPSLSQQDAFKKDIQLEARDIRYIWEKRPQEQRSRLAFLNRILAAGNVFLSVMILFGLWKERQDRIFAKDIALKRRRFARMVAGSRIRRLKAMGRSESPEAGHAYFEEIQKILTQYLTDKFNLSVFGTTRGDLERTLESSLGPEDPLHKNILELYRICDEARFGKGQIPHELKAQAFKILEETVARVERMRK